MTTFSRPSLCLLAMAVALPALVGAATAAEEDLFADATLAPADATVYLHVEGAAGLRRQLAGRPLARWIESVLLGGELMQACDRLAAGAGLAPGELFDRLLGRSVTVISRPGVDESPAWVIISDVEAETLDPVLARLRPRLRLPRAHVAIAELPEHDLLIAMPRGRLIAGPTAAAGLVYETIDRIAAAGDADAPGASLARHAGVRRGARLGKGQIGVLLRHDPPMGGWSALVLDHQGDQLSVRCGSRFENGPFQRTITRLVCDFSPVGRIENKAIAVVMEPMDVGDGPLESFLQVQLGAPILDAGVRDRLGDRRIVVLGEEDGRQRRDRVDLLGPTVGLCMEMRSSEGALELVDENMLRVTRALQELGRGAFDLDIPERIEAQAGASRTIDLGPASRWFVGQLPVMRDVGLSWTVADTPGGAWLVVSSTPRHLEDVVDALSEPAAGPPLRRRLDSAGSINGVRLSHHLQSWADQAERFADPPEVEQFRQAMTGMAHLAAGVQRCRWMLSRPSANEMNLELELTLSRESERE